MIKPLRKRHLQIWLILLVLLPAGIISAWMAIPAPVRDHLLQPTATNALPLVIKTTTNLDYTVNLRSAADRSGLQLEWINKSGLTSPSAIIYQAPEAGSPIENAFILGRIEPKGIYHFPLKMDSSNLQFHFMVYDIVHHQIINRINF
jgi:hypothetical protein